jgi:hypothetical protein
MRERQENLGVDAAFADAVAATAPLGTGEAAQWTVTFGVGDADATAERARELGGEVLVEPFDAGPVRNVVIRDPQGATFSGSRFYPERLMAQREEAAASGQTAA